MHSFSELNLSEIQFHDNAVDFFIVPTQLDMAIQSLDKRYMCQHTGSTL